MKAYSRRGGKGGISDGGARVGRAERCSYKLGWRSLNGGQNRNACCNMLCMHSRSSNISQQI